LVREEKYQGRKPEIRDDDDDDVQVTALCDVVRWWDTNVSEDHAASIFTLSQPKRPHLESSSL
jgi:hypothetical protein